MSESTIETIALGSTPRTTPLEQIFATLNGELLIYAVAIAYDLTKATTTVRVTSAPTPKGTTPDFIEMMLNETPVEMVVQRGRTGECLRSQGKIAAAGGATTFPGIGECETFVFEGDPSAWH